jgi:hypothetical protein
MELGQLGWGGVGRWEEVGLRGEIWPKNGLGFLNSFSNLILESILF